MALAKWSLLSSRYIKTLIMLQINQNSTLTRLDMRISGNGLSLTKVTSLELTVHKAFNGIGQLLIGVQLERHTFQTAVTTQLVEYMSSSTAVGATQTPLPLSQSTMLSLQTIT